MRCNIYTFGKAAVFYLEQISDILPSSGAVPLMCIVLPGSVMVTQLPVKELIVGSNPTRGAEHAFQVAEGSFVLVLIGFLPVRNWRSA